MQLVQMRSYIGCNDWCPYRKQKGYTGMERETMGKKSTIMEQWGHKPRTTRATELWKNPGRALSPSLKRTNTLLREYTFCCYKHIMCCNLLWKQNNNTRGPIKKCSMFLAGDEGKVFNLFLSIFWFLNYVTTVVFTK